MHIILLVTQTLVIKKNSGALKHFIKNDLKKLYKVFLNETHRIKNTNAFVKSNKMLTKCFAIKREIY